MASAHQGGATALLLVLAAVALGDAGDLFFSDTRRARTVQLGKGGGGAILQFSHPAVAAMREARRPRLILRGGFDVWGDDGDAPAEGTAKQGLKEVREAAREAAAKARSFKPASGAGRDAVVDKDSMPPSHAGASGALRRRGKLPGGEEKKKKSKGGSWLQDMGKPLDVSDSEEEEEESPSMNQSGAAVPCRAGAGKGSAATAASAAAAASAVARPGHKQGRGGQARQVDGGANVVVDRDRDGRQAGAGGAGDQEEEEDEESSSSDGSSSSGNQFESNDKFEEDAMQMGSDEFDFDDDEEGDDAIPNKEGGQDEEGAASLPRMSASDQEAVLDDDFDGEEEDGSEEFQPNPKWLLPEFRPPGWVESDTNNARRTSTDADVAEVMAGSLGAGKGASSSKRSKGGSSSKGADAASLAEGMGKLSVKGKKKGGKEGKRQQADALANLIPVHKIVLPAPGARCNMDGSSDPYYRYTMPGVNVKVEGATKMIKTVIMNIAELAQAVGRPPEYIVAYFGQECSSMATIDTKFGIEGRAWVSGKHEQPDLQKLVFRFIRECCLCRKCAGPETAVVVEGKKKRKIVSLDCKSCGARTLMDQSGRFTKWISTRPPSDAVAAWGQVDSGMGVKDIGEGEPGGGIATTKGRGNAAENHSKVAGTASEAVKGNVVGVEGVGAAAVDKGADGFGNGGVDDAMTLEELKEWRDGLAKTLKKLVKAGTISEEEYEVRKMNAKDIYRSRKLAIEDREAEDGDDDAGMTFTPGINANML